MNEVQGRIRSINAFKLDKNEGMSSKNNGIQSVKPDGRLRASYKNIDSKTIEGREFGGPVLGNSNKYNIEMGGGSIDHRSSQGE